MAVVYNGTAGNKYTRTTNLPALTNFTVCWWYKWNTDTPPNTMFNIDNGTSNYLYVQKFSALQTDIWWNIGGTSNQFTFLTFSTGTWYFMALTVNGTSINGYYAPAGTNTLTNVSGSASGAWFTPSNMVFGDSVFTSEQCDGQQQNMMMWTATLTQQELEQQMKTFRPQRYTNLHAWYPQLPGSGERARDYSGNGYNMTETGTITDAEPYPPISWGGRVIYVNYGSAPTLTQNAFRFRNDNGSETTATWRQTQNTNDSNTSATRFRLRFLLNATGDPTAKNFRLEVKKSTDTAYRKVTIKQ